MFDRSRIHVGEDWRHADAIAEPMPDLSATGVCLPRGGPRALAAANGEMRGLEALGFGPELASPWRPALPATAPLDRAALDPGRLRWSSGGLAENLSFLDPLVAGAPSGPASGHGNLCLELMPLLRRSLGRILIFVNGGTPLSMSSAEVIVDAELPPLFGLEWSGAAGSYVKAAPASPSRFHQVFDRATFDDLRRQLWNRAHAGATAMAEQPGVTVRPNLHFGIPGGTVDLLWIYLHPVNAWYRSLHDTVRLAMELEPFDYAQFPNYHMLDNFPLTTRQINLLAHLAAWNVAAEVAVGGYPSNAEVVRGFLGG
jgi:hypothetical protein